VQSAAADSGAELGWGGRIDVLCKQRAEEGSEQSQRADLIISLTLHPRPRPVHPRGPLPPYQEGRLCAQAPRAKPWRQGRQVVRGSSRLTSHPPSVLLTLVQPHDSHRVPYPPSGPLLHQEAAGSPDVQVRGRDRVDPCCLSGGGVGRRTWGVLGWCIGACTDDTDRSGWQSTREGVVDREHREMGLSHR
jgi:hypothetical protein